MNIRLSSGRVIEIGKPDDITCLMRAMMIDIGSHLKSAPGVPDDVCHSMVEAAVSEVLLVAKQVPIPERWKTMEDVLIGLVTLLQQLSNTVSRGITSSVRGEGN